MLVRISGNEAVLEQGEVFTAFAAVLVGPSLADAPFVGEWGRFDGNHAWVSSAWLRQQRPEGDQAGSIWLLQLDGMLEYASSKEWMSDDGSEVRVHVGSDEV